MKYIFDFDDVLFKNTELFKEHLYKTLSKSFGVSVEDLRRRYAEARGKFSLENFIAEFTEDQQLISRVYQDIMNKCLLFVNRELYNLVRSLGVDSCYLVTSGDPEFQKAKVENSGYNTLFKKIYYVTDSKKAAIEEICEANKGEERIYFIDDKEEHFQALEREKYPNLQTISFPSGEFDKFKTETERRLEGAREITKRPKR